MVIAFGVCAIIFLGIFPSAAPWLAQESIFEFAAREPKNNNPAKPSASPNGGPAELPDNPDVSSGAAIGELNR